LFGVVFEPGEAAACMGLSVECLRDRVVRLADIFGREARALVERLRELATDDARRAHLDAWLLARAG
jgi:hypothetical protein